MAPILVEAPRQVERRKELQGLRRGLIERISLTATILVFVAVIFVAGAAGFLVRSVLTAYEGQQGRLGAIATQPAFVTNTSWNEWMEGSQVEPSSSYGDLYLAWVCTMCSAAFPIAVQTKFFGGAKPLYEDGRPND